MRFEKLEEKNTKRIVEWNEGKDACFLLQWAGLGYEYPLTTTQITKRLKEGIPIFQAILDDQMVGTIEIIRIENDSALIGRFIIQPDMTGKGLGSQIIHTIKEYCKTELQLKEVHLHVFEYNKPALQCYIKNGFQECNRFATKDGKIVLEMKTDLYD